MATDNSDRRGNSRGRGSGAWLAWLACQAWLAWLARLAWLALLVWLAWQALLLHGWAS